MILVTYNRYPNLVFRVTKLLLRKDGEIPQEISDKNENLCRTLIERQGENLSIYRIEDYSVSLKNNSWNDWEMDGIPICEWETDGIPICELKLYHPPKLGNRRFPLQKNLKFIPK